MEDSIHRFIISLFPKARKIIKYLNTFLKYKDELEIGNKKSQSIRNVVSRMGIKAWWLSMI